MRKPALAVLAVVLLAACRSAPPPAVNALPADCTAVAAIDVAQLRATPVYAQLPPALRALTDPLAQARELAIGWNGKELLLVARGDFSEPPAGYTAIGKGIAAAGSPGRVEAARGRVDSGAGPALALPVSTAEIRAVVRGDGGLPLTGNLANILNLLSGAQSTTLTAHVENAVEIDISAQCGSIEGARQLEQSARGALTLATGTVRDPEAVALLRKVRLGRESLMVRLQAMAPVDLLAKLY